jgi:ribonuclease D
MKLDYRLAFINEQPRLTALSESLGSVSALALDIERSNWWHPPTERVALIQLAYRVKHELRVAVVDALAGLNPTILRQPLELKDTIKVIHNAVFDAVRLSRHFRINTTPIHDTLVAARRNGEKRYSLKAQVERHLPLPLDKRVRQSDWSLRPLHPQQLDYAARDVVATLLLYEHQLNRGLSGDYRLRAEAAVKQTALPLDASHSPCRRG